MATPTLEIDGHVATIRLNRADDHNRIHPEDLDAISAHLRAIDQEREVRVLILKSTGKTFSSGFHLGAIGSTSPRKFEETADALANCRVPSIAALQGGVFGGAADLVLACDFRIGVEGIELMVPAARIGVPYYPSGVERFVTRLGMSAAKRILLSSEKLDARALLDAGFLDVIVLKEDLEASVAELAGTLAAQAPMATQALKKMLNEAAVSRLDRHAAEKLASACLDSAEHKEGLAAWIEKRKPRFKSKAAG
ncbi:MAG TPA: enoyl-CoA hydratase/isomerase family protein [Bryobacteraceae bacterium]|nr:enoyl-CoA hydratase/isomerase family protein [Bryobacteraceae bacterium]